jgi:hypothetical protein
MLAPRCKLARRDSAYGADPKPVPPWDFRRPHKRKAPFVGAKVSQDRGSER